MHKHCPAFLLTLRETGPVQLYCDLRRHPAQSPANVKTLPPDPECQKGYLLAGSVKARGAGYSDQFVRVHGVDLDTKLHVTPTELLLNAMLIDLSDGGHIAGDMRINNWLGQIPEDTAQKSPTVAASQQTANTTAKAINSKPPFLVPFRVRAFSSQFREKGLRYSQMNAEQREQPLTVDELAGC